MSDEETRIVWVLGSGFSRPLGGPTLEQLLSPSSHEELKLRFPIAEYPRVHNAASVFARRLYLYGRAYDIGRIAQRDNALAGERLWDHAETFLDYLDVAAGAPDSVAYKQVERVLDRLREPGDLSRLPAVEDVHHAARRLVALECCGFADGVDTNTEKWAPFRRWRGGIDNAHTVITFNYDRVLEKIGLFYVVMPDDSEEKKAQPAVRVFKLHGSVDWRRHADGTCESVDSDNLPATCEDAELVIATPGPTKLSEAGKLKALWDLAMIAMKEADAIVFVGYRFPPSDSEAREVLLKAVSNSQRRHLDLHVVLGPDVHSQHAARLSGLLTYAANASGRLNAEPISQAATFLVHTHPLYCEDFLSVFTEHVLLGLRDDH
ncbi:MAG: SIR2 family protein [Myxococcales bacterium]|nr:SIR2 family protein [Myxococcales bacterium]